MVFLNPNIDQLGAGYTIIQSKIAIGSGTFFGKGWLAGTQSQLRSQLGIIHESLERLWHNPLAGSPRWPSPLRRRRPRATWRARV